MEGDHRDGMSVQLMQVVNGTPHIGYRLDFHFVTVLIAGGVQCAAFFPQFVLGHKLRTVLVVHESSGQGGDGTRAGPCDKNIVGVDAILFSVRHQIAERGMRILNSLVTTLLDRTFGDGEPHSVVDGGHHVTAFREMFAPAPHVLGPLVSHEIGTAVEYYKQRTLRSVVIFRDI